MKAEKAEAFVNAILGSQAALSEQLAALGRTLDRMREQLAAARPPVGTVPTITGFPFFSDVVFREPRPGHLADTTATPGRCPAQTTEAFTMKAIPCTLDEGHRNAHRWRHGHITGAFAETLAPDERPAEDPTADQRHAWMREALQSVLDALDGWIDGAKETHQAQGHRAEPCGSECWRSFAPADIRAMVNDAARDLMLGPNAFEAPEHPREDQR